MFDVAKRQNLSIDRLEIRNGQWQRGTKLLALQRFGRNLPPIGKVDRDIVALVAFMSAVNRVFPGPQLFAQAMPGFVQRDLNDPGGELTFTAKLREVLEG